MERIRVRDFLLGMIAACLMLITVKVYDTGSANRVYAEEQTKPMQVEIVGQVNPLVIKGQEQPLRVELVRPDGFTGRYRSVIDEKGAIQAQGAIPVEIMARDGGQLRSLQGRNGALRTANY